MSSEISTYRDEQFSDIWLPETSDRMGQMLQYLMERHLVVLVAKPTNTEHPVARLIRWTMGTSWGPVHGVTPLTKIDDEVTEDLWVATFPELGYVNGNTNSPSIKDELSRRLDRYPYLQTPSVALIETSHEKGWRQEDLIHIRRRKPLNPVNPLIQALYHSPHRQILPQAILETID